MAILYFGMKKKKIQISDGPLEKKQLILKKREKDSRMIRR